jgi:endoglucanase
MIIPNSRIFRLQDVNNRLGKGINISSFEADASWQTPFDTSYFRIIAGLGFTHVRIPIK